MPAPRTLICGSLALDTIMVFPDRFARHILPGETHVLSVSFQIGEMRREWGGCAGNIAYNLKRLGGEPVVMATVGDDGNAYVERLKAQQVAADGVRVIPGTYTAQAFIITDLDDNQITAFHPGAMNESHRNRVTDVADIALGIVAPDGREGMRAHVQRVRRCEDSVHVRSGAGAAAVLGCGAAGDDRLRRLPRGQRLRRRGCSPSAPAFRSKRWPRASRR